MTPMIIFRRYQRHQWTMILGDNSTGDKFIASINETGKQWSPVTVTPVINFSPVSTTPVNNDRRWQRHRRWHFSPVSLIPVIKKQKAGVNYTIFRCKVHSTKLFTKNEKKLYLKIFLFYRRCRWHRWQTFVRDYLREFSKKSNRSQWHTKKTWSRKSCVRLPFSRTSTNHMHLSWIGNVSAKTLLFSNIILFLLHNFHIYLLTCDSTII